MWLVALWGCAAATDRIGADDLHAALRSDRERYYLVDVRTRTEFDGPGGHLEGAEHLAYPGIHWRPDRIAPAPGPTVVLICLTGHRSRLPLAALRASHPQHTIVDLRGGMRAWWAAGLPTVQTP